jgi:beta-propeller repeat-containing protein
MPRAGRAACPPTPAVRYHAVYPGIDLVFYGKGRALEHDFVVAPGADPASIRLLFEGATSVHVDEAGELVLPTPAGPLWLSRPVLYQEVDGVRREVAGSYRIDGEQVGFAVGDYDRSRPLVIDPVPAWANRLGGSGTDAVVGVLQGGVFVVGSTTSADLPLGSPPFGPPFDGSYNGGTDVFVARLESQGGSVLLLTYLGGSGDDRPVGIGQDSAGNIYVAGTTSSSDFPTTPGAFATTSTGNLGFVTKLDGGLFSLVYSTRFPAGIGGFAVDGAGAAYLTGFAGSSFPATPGAYQTTFTGGPHPSGNPALGSDAFVAKLNPAGSALVYGTFLGTSSGSEGGVGIAVDASGQATLLGNGAASDFPRTTTATGDAFVARFSADGSRLVYSALVGRGSPARSPPTSSAASPSTARGRRT